MRGTLLPDLQDGWRRGGVASPLCVAVADNALGCFHSGDMAMGMIWDKKQSGFGD